VDRKGDSILTREVFNARHVILSLKLVNHKGLTLFCLCLVSEEDLDVVLPATLIQTPVCAFLNPVPIYG